jgi:hypothetical protein
MTEKFKELLLTSKPHKVIADLIQQATGYNIAVYEINGVRTLGERVEFFDKEKFAQLIVAECALQCVHNEDMDLIEKHFGVEL